MVGRIFSGGAVLALILRIGGANAEPHPEPTLVPPVSPTCISSPFGPRALANHPQAGTNHRGVDLPTPPGASIVATAPGKVIRIQKKGPGGLEILVQHEGFVAIYSHLGWPPQRLLKAKKPSRQARNSVLLEELESRSARMYILRCSWPECRSIRRDICVSRIATARDEQRRLDCAGRFQHPARCATDLRDDLFVPCRARQVGRTLRHRGCYRSASSLRCSHGMRSSGNMCLVGWSRAASSNAPT